MSTVNGGMNVLPIGPLMTEHRLIEQMIRLVGKEVASIKEKGEANTDLIGEAVNFLKVYADECHHGKEEDILFKYLSEKKMSSEHRRTMDELVKEHALGRKNVRELASLVKSYRQGESDKLGDITGIMEKLAVFYPKHIEKEDKHFFIPCMEYFTGKEQEKMLDEMWQFDKTLIHKHYASIVKNWENSSRSLPWGLQKESSKRTGRQAA